MAKKITELSILLEILHFLKARFPHEPVQKAPAVMNGLQEYEAERTRLDRLERLPGGWFKDRFLSKLKGRDIFWSPDSLEKHIVANDADAYAAQYGRQPEIDEWESLVDRTNSKPAIIEAAKVLNLKTDDWYSSKTPVAGDSSDVWCVDFYYGYVGYGGYKGIKFYVRPVRSSQ
jgi:hypothetical protein